MMYIATINNQKFALEKIGDAEALLEILARAQPVNYEYPARYKYFLDPEVPLIEIAIENAELLPREEVRRLAEEEKARRAAITKGEQE